MIILSEFDNPETRLEWMLALLHAATALRPEEAFGLKWEDIDWRKGQIDIRRGWSKGKETPGKNEGSMTQVVMHPALAQALQIWSRESVYHRDSDWVDQIEGEGPSFQPVRLGRITFVLRPSRPARFQRSTRGGSSGTTCVTRWRRSSPRMK